MDLLKVEHPIILSPMPLGGSPSLALAVCAAGGLGSIGCALSTPDAAAREIATMHASTDGPFAVNFFCHAQVAADLAAERVWNDAMRPYYRAWDIPFEPSKDWLTITPFDDAMCDVLERAPPAVVSFHFGLPARHLVHRLKALGCPVMSSATTVEEARWLEANGADIVIAQGVEAGGHRGTFLPRDPIWSAGGDIGTFALVPQVADAVSIPVVAAGGIADGRGIAAAFALGADGVQIGTGYLRCPEAEISSSYRRALEVAESGSTVVTNVFTGRAARSIVNRVVRDLGPISSLAPAFPSAMTAMRQLAFEAARQGDGDFTPFWAGEAVALARPLPAGELTALLVTEAMRAFLGEVANPTNVRLPD
ncbi:nitronate monooxygenase [Sphingomonas sp. PP-CC-3A-396]|uniref:NAD(P)H-dependent flavin oxidoreductase n=1 Tax=Sphingomonas sp. PP-CC-3A-396 TaxID=2135655 RepID=UPI00104A0975|nr:nitronate monooxygenase [Sphingomonas sp. PP-CC-3A-396]